MDEVSFAGRVVYICSAKKAVSYETKCFVMKELDIHGLRHATMQNFADIHRPCHAMQARVVGERGGKETVPITQKPWQSFLMARILVLFTRSRLVPIE